MNNYEIVKKLSLNQKAALLSGKNTWETYNIDEESIPSIFLSDGPHGLRKQEGAGDHLGINQSIPATCFPTAATLANSWNIELCEGIGSAIAKESVANNVHILLGPGLNLKRNPLCGRNFEYYSEDPLLSGKLAAAFVNGVQKEGIAACPKHFAANNQELRRMSSDSIVDERTLRELYLTGFEIVVKESNPKAIMSAYNKINGEYANENSHLLMDILRNEWGFEGIVVSDWGGDNNRVKAIESGSHLAMPSLGIAGQKEVVTAIQKGILSEKVLDQRVEELLNVILNISKNKKEKDVDLKQHHNLAKKAAEESIVLLKNEDNILPLSKGKKIGVIGEFAETPRYQGAGSSLVNPTQIDSFLNCLKDSTLDVVGFAKGYHRIDREDNALIEEAVNLAKKSEAVVLYLGLNEISESEGLDRSTLSIPNNQLQLLTELKKVNCPIIVLLAGGSVIDMSWDESVQAVLHGYLNGQAGAESMVAVLEGRVNPSGKLAETYPSNFSEIPSSKGYPSSDAYSYYREGIYVGYRYFDKSEIPVKYPFGHGLSFTEFGYELLEVDSSGIRLSVTNKGNFSGSEIVQMYVSLPNSNIYRANKELKGFIKVNLEVGETKKVKIPFDEFTFRYFDVEENKFQVEKGEYQILVGSSSQDIRLATTLNVEGKYLEKKDNNLQSYWIGNVLEVSDEEFELLLGRKLPKEKLEKGLDLQLNDPILKMKYAKSFLARIVYKQLYWMLKKAEKKGVPDLNLLFLYNMPFRALAKMTNGVVDIPMVEGILKIVNGRFIKGMNDLLKSWNQKRKYERSIHRS